MRRRFGARAPLHIREAPPAACGKPASRRSAENPAPRIRSSPDDERSATGEALCERRPTMNPIILATDGSPSAAEATKEAVELARATGAKLFVVSVWHAGLTTYSTAALPESKR